MDETLVKGQLLLLLSGGLLALMATLMAIRAGLYRPLPKLSYRSIPSFGDLIFVFLAYFLFYVVILPLGLYLGLSLYRGAWQSASGMQLSHEMQVLINCASLWLCLFVLWLLCRIFQPTALKCVRDNEMAVTKSRQLYNLALGGVSWFACFPVVFCFNQLLAAILELFFHPVEVDQVAVKLLKMTHSYLYLQTFYLIAIIFIVPITEEFIFRGILQRWLSPKIGPWLAITGASVTFAALHYSGSQGVFNFVLLPSLFLLSCYLGYLYERQRSLWAPIGLHAMFNFMSASMLILEQ